MFSKVGEILASQQGRGKEDLRAAFHEAIQAVTNVGDLWTQSFDVGGKNVKHLTKEYAMTLVDATIDFDFPQLGVQAEEQGDGHDEDAIRDGREDHDEDAIRWWYLVARAFTEFRAKNLFMYVTSFYQGPGHRVPGWIRRLGCYTGFGPGGKSGHHSSAALGLTSGGDSSGSDGRAAAVWDGVEDSKRMVSEMRASLLKNLHMTPTARKWLRRHPLPSASIFQHKSCEMSKLLQFA